MGKRGKKCLRYFRCPECGSTLTATKRISRATGNGHLKYLYCPICRKEVNAEQYDRERF